MGEVSELPEATLRRQIIRLIQRVQAMEEYTASLEKRIRQIETNMSVKRIA